MSRLNTASTRQHPRTIERVGDQSPNPADRLQSGYDRDNLFQQGNTTASGWELHEGFIDVAIPGLGYYVATIGGGVGRVPAMALARGGDWGSSECIGLQPNSKALFAVNRDRAEYVVISQLPTSKLDDATSFPNKTSIQSFVGSLYDPVVDFAKSTVDQALLFVTDTGQMVDAVVGDWMVSNAVGGHILVSSLTLAIVADEVTGIWVDVLDQRVEISGRKLHIESDGIRIASTSVVGKLQLAGKQTYVTDPVITPVEYNLEKLRSEDVPALYTIEGGESLFQFNVFATNAGAIASTDNYLESLTGNSIRGAESQSFLVGEFPKFCDYSDPIAEKIDVFPDPEDEKDREKVLERLKQWSEYEFQSIFSRPLQTVASLSQEFLLDEENFVHIAQKSEENLDVSETTAAITNSESFTPDVEEVDGVLHGKLLKIAKLLSFIKQLPDGSIMLGTEAGASIRIGANTVMIDCATLRVAAAKDVCVLGRDIQMLSGRNISMQANRHLRAYASANLNIIGGIRGEGGVLIESRGTNREITLGDDPEKAVFAGVVLRASKTFVAAHGGDVILDAGVGRVGSILCRSKEAMLMQTPTYAVASNGVLMLPIDPSESISATYIGRSLAVFGGSIKAKSAWFDGAVSARSNIQSFFGRMADSKGGPINRVSNTQQFTEAIQKLDKYVNQYVKQFIAVQKRVAERTAAKGGIVTEPITSALSGGFVQPGAAREHYGTADMQSSTMRTFEIGRDLSKQPLSSLLVRYREDSGSLQTFGWPGNTEEINVSTIPVKSDFISRCRAVYSEDPSEESKQEETFGEAFGTLD